jgi:hypothetical protein
MRNLLLSLLVLIVSLPAQTQLPALSGSYVLAEEGVSSNGPINTLATLRFAENGAVTGALLLHTDFDLLRFDVQGYYKMETDRAGCLVLSTSATDEEGNSITKEYKYRLVKTAAQELSAVRSNSGYYSTAKIYPAARPGKTGAFVYTEVGAAQKFSRLGVFNLETGGSVTGFQFIETFGAEELRDVKGSYVNDENGFGKLTLNSERTDVDGELQPVTEVFYFLATSSDIKMIRHEGHVQLLTMTK